MTVTQGEPSRSDPAERNAGIDAARGLAVVLMIQAHAYDAWLHPLAKASAAYRVSRQLSAIPASLFLLLAGIGLALTAVKQAPPSLRARLTRRGLGLLTAGYALSTCYALLDGELTLRVLLRADILHVIGLSLAVCASLLIGTPRPVSKAALLCAIALVASVALPHLQATDRTALVWAAPLALLMDVAPLTRFPLIPLVAFCAVGVVAAIRLLPALPTPRAQLVALLGFTLAAALLHQATAAAVAASGQALSRQHPAVVLNVLDQIARSLAVLCLGLWLAAKVKHTVGLRLFLRLGRRSLLVYAFHLPFCYGRPGRLIAGQLGFGAATIAIVGLVLLSDAIVALRDVLGRAWKH